MAGLPDQVDAVITAVNAQNRFARRVNMEVASHTALMDPVLAGCVSALAELFSEDANPAVLVDRHRPHHRTPIGR